MHCRMTGIKFEEVVFLAFLSCFLTLILSEIIGCDQNQGLRPPLAEFIDRLRHGVAPEAVQI